MGVGLVLQRLVGLVATVLIVSVATFLAMRLVPGDPARLIAGPEAPAETVELIRAEWGLDRPLHVQLGSFLAGLATGELGKSYRTKTPVWDQVKTRLVPTFLLTATGMGVALSLGIGAGVLSAIRRGKWPDTLIVFLSTLGISLPVFWVGILLMMLFAARLRWLPSSGYGEWKHLILPAFTLGMSFFASISRMTRSTMLEVLQEEYIRTARSKGLPEWRVLLKHGLRNALLPVITVAGLEFGRLLGGAVITESVFAWPGMGRLLVDSVKFRDYPMVQACVILLAVCIAVSTFLSDLLNLYVDPRLRRG